MADNSRVWVKPIILLLPILLTGVVVKEPAQAAASRPPDRFDFARPDTPVRIDVFSDYECPACRTFYLQTMKAVQSTYAVDGRVRVVYHDFPLEMHRHAREAARYSVAARRLGEAQWTALTNALYARQSQWSADGNIDLIAGQTLSPGDFARLRELLQDPSIDETLDKDLSLGRSLNVSSTPTFFIGVEGREQRVVGGVPYPVLASYLSRYLK